MSLVHPAAPRAQELRDSRTAGRTSGLVRRLLVVVGLGVLVGLGLALAANLPATMEAVSRFRWPLSPAIVAATLANYLLRFAKWEYYLRRLAIRLPRRQSALVFVAGFTMAISPGKLGEVLKAVLVRDLTGTAASRTASVVMAERLTDVAGLLVLAALGATALPYGGVLVAGVAGALTAAVIVLRVPALAAGIHAGLTRVPRLARLADPLRRFLDAGRVLLDPAALAVAVPLSVASWFFECLALYLVLAGLEAAAPLRTATFVYAFASLAGAVSMLPGGLGAAEGTLTGLLVALGTSLPDAAAATLLIRGATLWLAVLLGAGALLLGFRGVPPHPTLSPSGGGGG